jgi:hypothetical protein
VVVLLVNDDLQSEFVRALHESNEAGRSAICLGFDGARARLIVGPTRGSAADVHGHQLERRYAFGGEGCKVACGGIERAFGRESPDVQFVDDTFGFIDGTGAQRAEMRGSDAALEPGQQARRTSNPGICLASGRDIWESVDVLGIRKPGFAEFEPAWLVSGTEGVSDFAQRVRHRSGELNHGKAVGQIAGGDRPRGSHRDPGPCNTFPAGIAHLAQDGTEDPKMSGPLDDEDVEPVVDSRLLENDRDWVGGAGVR